MPHYDYRCRACSHEFEVFQSMSEGPRRRCPACGKPRLERLIGTGGGIVFRGSGFYQTDYREGGKGGDGKSSGGEDGATGKESGSSSADSVSAD